MAEVLIKMTMKICGWYFKLLFVTIPKAVWAACSWLYAKFTGRNQDVGSVKDITKKEQKRVSHFLVNAGLVEKTDVGILYPSIAKRDGEILIGVLDSQQPSDFEKHIRGLGEIFGYEAVGLVHVAANVYKIQRNNLPALVNYDERPAETSGFWVGTDYTGAAVEIDFIHTPAMLITGASGSGKSVFGLCLVNEATKAGYDVSIVDGKGGIDWLDAPCTKLLTDMEEIAAHYESLVDEMNERLKKLVELRAKNWIEATKAGYEMKPMLIFMDESSDFFVIGSKQKDQNYDVKWRIVSAVSELCRKSRAVGIYQAFSLQAAKSDSVPEDVKNNSGFRVSYALPTAAMSHTLFESSIAFDPSLRGGKGVFRGVEGDVRVFRGAYVG